MRTHPWRRRVRAAQAAFGPLLLFTACVPLAGCCSLAGLVCGPSKTAWPRRSYRSPEEALATVREALRRDDRRTLFESLGERFKAEAGIAGSFDVDVAVEKLEDLVPGFHLLGTADIGEPKAFPADPDAYPLRVTFPLGLAGRTFELAFVRQPFWEIGWVDPGSGERRRRGAYLSRSEFAAIYQPRTTDDGAAGWTARPRARLPEELLGLEGAPPDSEGLQSLEVGQEWKLDGLRQVVEEDAES